MFQYLLPWRSPRASVPAPSTLRRRGNTIILVAVSLPVLLGFAALTVDAGYMYLMRQELQTSADAAALAAAWTYVDENGNVVPAIATAQANLFAHINAEEAGAQVEFLWSDALLDPAAPFVPALPDAANAIRVTVTRSAENGNPVDLFFAGIFGQYQTDISASAVAGITPASGVDGVPIALAAPGFGPIDPEIFAANPGKAGPSEPADGVAFQLGEQVTLFTFGKGPKSPVHLVLNTNDIPGEVDLGKVLRGEESPVPLAIGDVLDVVGDGTGHGGLGGKLADRLDDGDPTNDTVLVPVVETLPDSRDADGVLVGNVRVIDFLAVHLDAVVEVTIPDPNDPQDTGKTIDIRILVGTIVKRAVAGSATAVASGVVDGMSVGIPQLIR